MKLSAINASGIWYHCAGPEWWNGRHEGLKNPSPQGGTGSSPVSGTNQRDDGLVRDSRGRRRRAVGSALL